MGGAGLGRTPAWRRRRSRYQLALKCAATASGAPLGDPVAVPGLLKSRNAATADCGVWILNRRWLLFA
jgi:hypothetical protein